MSRRQKSLPKRFSANFKRTKTSYINAIFSRLLHRRHNGKDFTVHMVTNWFYDRNENQIIDDVFENLMYEVDPQGLEEDKKNLQEPALINNY